MKVDLGGFEEAVGEIDRWRRKVAALELERDKCRLEADGVLESAAGLVDRVHEAETLVTVLTAALVEACSTHCAGCASQ